MGLLVFSPFSTTALTAVPETEIEYSCDSMALHSSPNLVTCHFLKFELSPSKIQSRVMLFYDCKEK